MTGCSSFLRSAAFLRPSSGSLGFLAFVLSVTVEPDGARSPWEHLERLRALPMLARSRVAALLPLTAISVVAAGVCTAHLTKRMFAEGAPRAAGAGTAISAVAIFLTFMLLALAASSPLRQVLARIGRSDSIMMDPGATLALGLLVAGALVAFGVATGDAGGDGRTPLAILGVLRRSELDLSPISHLGLLLLGAYTGLIVATLLTRGPHYGAALGLGAVALACSFFLPALTVRDARALDAHAEVTRAVEKRAAIGRIGLYVLRRASDRDRDGRSKYFGGFDCDDRDPTRSPDKLDVPGNGIDEDCSGGDTPAPKPKVPEKPPESETARGYNVVLITVDTLRADVGFLGYPKPITPNLDRLAERSTVFEHAYSMASYTGKSIGPMLIGKYPSETHRDGSHFNKYTTDNVFVTTRAHDAGVHTFGCAGHWYWKPWSGVTQGMDDFDLTAIPPDMTDNDTSVSGDRVSDVAVKMLAEPDNTKGRFFMWIHYFDPHAQYVLHPGEPDFRGGERGGAVETRAGYDGEVWFTDKEIGRVIDAVQSSSFAKDTAFIVTADHGEAFGEHGMSWHGAEIWEMLVHVPLLVYVPDGTGHRIKEKRSQIDLAPTILDLLAVKKPTDPNALDGKSWLPDINLVPGTKPEERDVYIDMPPGPWNYTRRAIISGPSPGMKLISLGGPQYQLFDLSTDPGRAHGSVLGQRTGRRACGKDHADSGRAHGDRGQARYTVRTQHGQAAIASRPTAVFSSNVRRRVRARCKRERTALSVRDRRSAIS